LDLSKAQGPKLRLHRDFALDSFFCFYNYFGEENIVCDLLVLSTFWLIADTKPPRNLMYMHLVVYKVYTANIYPKSVQPTGENGATRAPIIIDMERDKSGGSRGLAVVLEGRTQNVSASKFRSFKGFLR
jgi:hypothetical protein